jgi:uncharacterized protein (TIGR00290 family)
MKREVGNVKLPVVMSYSGGKDSSYALYTLQQDPNWSVVRLLSTGTREYQRNSMHGVRMELLYRQSESIGLPLDVVWMDANVGGKGYESAMKTVLNRYKSEGIAHVGFGDLYLEDVRQYREQMNSTAGIQSLFPVWGAPTKEFARSFIRVGFKAIVVCVDTTQLDASFCGREFDESLLMDLPEGVDWCAENGEFHTFCYDGPLFKEPISFAKGETVLRDERFYYLDLLPGK